MEPVPGIETQCRACLASLPEDTLDTSKHDIFVTPDLAQKLVSCTSLTVDPQDGLPNHLCECCFNKLNDFYQFQLMCVESVQSFRELALMKHSLLTFVDAQQELELELPLKQESVVDEKCDVLYTNEEAFVNVEEENHGMPQQPKAAIKMNKQSAKKLSSRKTRAATRQHQTASCESSASSSNDELDNDAVEEDESVSETSAGKLTRRKQHPSDKVSCTESSVKSSSFKCDICPARFFVEHRLIAHKRSHDGLVPYPCTQEGCERAFNRWHCLSEHLKQHKGTNRWYTCEEDGCGKIYKHKPTLVMHLRKYHKRGPEPKTHICEICGKLFKAAAILNDHRYTHKDKSELPFACDQPQCQRRFINKEKLKVHLLRHAGIKNFVCPYCGMRKTTRNELKIHINYHTLERTWPCRFCKHVCNSAGNLKMHVRTVHERAKDYACRYCERCFAKPDTRKYHEMTHTGEKPNVCAECGKRFTQPAALRTHMKIHKRHRAQPGPSATAAAIDSDVLVGSLDGVAVEEFVLNSATEVPPLVL